MKLNKNIVLQLLREFNRNEKIRRKNYIHQNSVDFFVIDLIDTIIKKINDGEKYSIIFPFPDIMNIGTDDYYNVSIFEYQKILIPILREKKLKRLKVNV